MAVVNMMRKIQLHIWVGASPGAGLGPDSGLEPVWLRGGGTHNLAAISGWPTRAVSRVTRAARSRAALSSRRAAAGPVNCSNRTSVGGRNGCAFWRSLGSGRLCTGTGGG